MSNALPLRMRKLTVDYAPYLTWADFVNAVNKQLADNGIPFDVEIAKVDFEEMFQNDQPPQVKYDGWRITIERY